MTLEALDEPVRRYFARALHGGAYIPCGCEARAERRFGDVVVPSSVTVGWWFGTPRYAPFFEADVNELALAG